MRILVKTLAIIGITLTVLVVFLLLASRFILLESYAELEERDAQANVMRTLNALQAKLDLIASYTSDWAPWSATYDFVQGNLDGYAEEYLVDAAFTNIGINLMLFTDPARNPVHAAYYSLAEEQEEPVPSDVVTALIHAAPLFQDTDEPRAVSGLVRVDDRLILVASHPILRSDFSGPAAGYLLFARVLDATVQEMLAERVQLPIHFYALESEHIPAGLRQPLIETNEAAPVELDTHSAISLLGVTLIRDVNGAPIAFLAIEIPREIYARGLATQRFLFASTILLALFFGFTVAILLTGSVVRPIATMIKDTRKIAEENNPAYRLRVSGKDEVAILTRSINDMLDRLHQAQLQIQHSEERNRALIEAVPDTLIRIDSSGTILDFKAAKYAPLADINSILGTSLDESLRALDVDLPTDVRNDQIKAIVNSLYHGETMVTEFQSGRNNQARDYEFRVVGFGGVNREALILIRDITERKQAELAERSILLLQEVHHRVKNNLQVISSLLSLQARQVKDPEIEAMFKNSQTRVVSMALIHEKLYGTRQFDTVDFSDYVRELTRILFSTYNTSTNRIKLEVETDVVFLPVDKAVPFGLIVNELVSNAFKYAFPDGQSGTVRVEVRRKGTDYTLLVRDSGVGLSGPLEELSRESLGMQLVQSLVQQLGGRLLYENNHGSVFRVEISI